MRTKWALKTKFDENEQISRYRARFVTLGNSQRPGIEYNLTYSPVVKSRTLRILFAASVELEWEVHYVDIKAAYLAADLPDGYGTNDLMRTCYNKEWQDAYLTLAFIITKHVR